MALTNEVWFASKDCWRVVPGFPNYEVSGYGEVRRAAFPGRGRKRKFDVYPAKVLRQYSDGVDARQPYLKVTLPGNKKGKIHLLMLEAFLGPRPEGAFGCHRNDDPQDNRLENLYWGSPSDNGRDAVANGKNFFANKTHCKRGHPFSGDNLKFQKNGRDCRACGEIRRAKYKERLRSQKEST